MQRTEAYKVAGHVFSLEMDGEDGAWSCLGNYAPFKCDASQEAIFKVKVVSDFAAAGRKPFYITDPGTPEQRIDIYTLDDGYLFEMAPFGSAPVCGALKVNADFSLGLLKAYSETEYCINNALMLLYAFRTAGLGTVEIHASVTVKDGRGFLFLGKSGTGKSTHSRLWLKNVPGSRLLNDDNPVIRLVDGIPRVFGTPWSGKTHCYINEDYPVGAFVRINRAPHNAIRMMGIAESFASLYSSSSGLRAIKEIADGLFETVSAVVQAVPGYLLDCLPDDGAALVCSTEVLGNE